MAISSSTGARQGFLSINLTFSCSMFDHGFSNISFACFIIDRNNRFESYWYTGVSTVGLRKGGALVLIILPLYIPVLIFGKLL